MKVGHRKYEALCRLRRDHCAKRGLAFTVVMMGSNLPDLHLEISTKCALRCPLCPRTEHIEFIKAKDMPLEWIRKIAERPIRYKTVSLCGDHGDPIYHSEFHQVVETLQTLPGRPGIIVSTNGSHRKPEWWSETARTLRKKDRVIFGVDGLESTASLHRIGMDWQSVIRAMKILKSEGTCEVWWQWILFRQNQDQLSEAAQMVKDLKIDGFYILQTPRMDPNDPRQPQISLAEARRQFKVASHDLSAL